MSLAWLLAGCLGDKGVAPSVRPADSTLNTIVASPLNAIMAVGETLSVAPIGRSVSGEPIAAFDSVVYRLENITDTARVSVSAAGVVTARSPSPTYSPILLTVIAFKDGVAAADQSTIQVVATAFPGATLSIQPIAPDTAKMAWGDSKTITPVIQNTTGDFVDTPTLRFEYGAGDSLTMQCYMPTIAGTSTLSQSQLQRSRCGQNGNAGPLYLDQIHAFKKGTAWVYADVTVFGVPLRDSVLYTISNPYGAGVGVGAQSFLAGDRARTSVFIAPGGTVDFVNEFNSAIGASVAFTLDNPSAALAADPPSQYGGTSGNISSLTSGQLYSSRRFMTPGVYRWTATVSGGIAPYTGATATGLITVE